MNQQVISFLKAALECSVLVAPLSPGLTYAELCEIGKAAGYQQGQIDDALPHAAEIFGRDHRALPSETDRNLWKIYFPEEPEYRNFRAFDFVIAELNSLVRSEGAAKARIDRSVLVERATARDIASHDVQLAITWLSLSALLTEKDGLVRFTHATGEHGLPSDQLRQMAQQTPARQRPDRLRAYPIVKDVVARRTDGRPAHAEPLDAFADEIDKLGYHPFRLWWTQTVTELRRADPSYASVSACVLAAALVEAALTFIVKHARNSGHFQSPDYQNEPDKWKIDKLVASAASGGPAAILSPQAKARAETLIMTRQRIHAGRMLKDYPAGPPDLRPDEAREAKAIAEQVVRAVLDWLQRNPASP